MPRVKNIMDYFSDNPTTARYPIETMIEVPSRDSVQKITVHLEPRFFVQIARDVDKDDRPIWKVATNLSVVITKDDSVLREQ